MTDPLLLPANALPGLLTGWCGPLLVPGWDKPELEIVAPLGPDPDDAGRLLVSRAEGWDVMNDSTWCRSVPVADIRLDPQREEVACRIARVLRAIDAKHEVGALLPRALGGRVDDVGTIPAAEVSAALLVASVAGVQRGLGVVQGVLGEWREVAPGFWERTSVAGMEADVYVGANCWYVRGTNIYAHTDRGTAGPAGRDAADAAALRLGFALTDPTAAHGVCTPFALETR